MDGEIKLCERYVPEARIRHCTQCQSYGHRVTACKQSKRCARCGGPHGSEGCQIAQPPKCKTCNGAHPEVAGICRNRREEVVRAKRAIERTPYLFEKETINNEPQPSQNQSQQATSEWTKVEKGRKGRPTNLEKAGADPRQTKLPKIGEKRARDSLTPPKRAHPNSPKKVVNNNSTPQEIDIDDYMSDD
jgi:hypothetical protein